MKKFKFTKFSYNSNREIINDKQNFGAELRRLVSLANKRIKRLDELSPAKRDLNCDAVLKNGKFTARGNMEEKIATYNRLKTFINSPTSTKTGFNEYLNNIAKKKNISVDNVKEILKKVNNQVGSIIYDTSEIYSLMNNDEMKTLPSNEMSIEEYDAWVKKMINESYTPIAEQIKEKNQMYQDFEKNANHDLKITPDEIDTDDEDIESSIFDKDNYDNDGDDEEPDIY